MAASEPPYRFEIASGYSVVVIQPELNDSQWSDFEAVGNDLLHRIGDIKPPTVLVDLTGLNYMGSAMVALIVRLWKSIRERGGKMVVINRNEMVFEVLKLAGLNNVWTIVHNREQALKEVGKRGSGRQSSIGMLLALGAVGVVVAAVGLAMTFGLIPKVGPVKVATAITVAGAALGLFGGTMSAARGSEGEQKAGILIVIASAAILILGIVIMPAGGESPAKEAPSNVENAKSPHDEAGSQAPSDPATKRKKRRDDRKDSGASSAKKSEKIKPAQATDPGKAGDAPPANAKAPDAKATPEEAPKNAADTKDAAPKEGAGKLGKLNLLDGDKKEEK